MSTYDSNTPYVVVDRYSDLEAASPAKQTQLPPRNPIAANPANGYVEPSQEKGQPKAFGRGTWAFVAIVALVSALVIGGAIGGGLGATLASCENDKRNIMDQML